jgi:hypothetical protein
MTEENEMKNFGHCNELKRFTREQYDREVARCANRISWALVAGAAIILLVLEVLPCATCS